MILAQGMRVALFGVGGGIVAAFLLTRFLAALLYGVAATDLLTFVMVTALVLAVAAVATAFPAWRATRIDPLKSNGLSESRAKLHAFGGACFSLPIRAQLGRFIRSSGQPLDHRSPPAARGCRWPAPPRLPVPAGSTGTRPAPPR